MIGQTPINDTLDCSLLTPNVFPRNYLNAKSWLQLQKDIISNIDDYVVYNQNNNSLVTELIDLASNMYQDIYLITKDILETHIPKTIHDNLETILYNIFYQETIGMLCYIIIKEKILHLPDNKRAIILLIKK